ncbi:MAG: hypothetical protein ACLVHV_09405 [Oscillospiraceae bacterium]
MRAAAGRRTASSRTACYTKTLAYEDINYAVASTEDQSAIFNGWSAFLNYFDAAIPFQLTFVNRRSHAGGRYEINIPSQPMMPLTASGRSSPKCSGADRQKQQRH